MTKIVTINKDDSSSTDDIVINVGIKTQRRKSDNEFVSNNTINPEDTIIDQIVKSDIKEKSRKSKIKEFSKKLDKEIFSEDIF